MVVKVWENTGKGIHVADKVMQVPLYSAAQSVQMDLLQYCHGLVSVITGGKAPCNHIPTGVEALIPYLLQGPVTLTLSPGPLH